MNLYSTAEAAQELNMSIAALKYHIYTAKTLSGQLVGKSLVFTQDEIDRFQSVRRRPGRPKKQPDFNAT
jgi:hypothetical protein